VTSTEPETSFAARSQRFIGGVYLGSQTVDRIAAFVLLALLAALFGATRAADTYFLASIGPLAIGSVFGEPLARSFQTLFAARRDEKDGALLAAAGFALTASALFVLTAIYLAVALPIVGLVGEGRIWIWVVLAVTGPALGLITYSSSVLVWLEDYVWSALRFPLVSVSALVLASVAAALSRSLFAVAVAVAIAYVGATVVLYILVARKLGARWGIRFDRGEITVATAGAWGRIRAPIIGGLLSGQVIALVERYLAAALAPGSVALISYVRGIAGAPSIVAQSFGGGVYPALVRANAAQSPEATAYIRAGFLRGLRLTVFFGGAFATFFAFFSTDIVTIVLQRGVFEPSESQSAARLLVLLALWTLSGSIGFYLVFVLYGIDFFAGILYFESAVFLPYLVLAPVLRGALGLDGLALALSLAHSVGATVGVGVVSKRLGVRGREIVEALIPSVWRVALLAVVGVGIAIAVGRGATSPIGALDRTAIGGGTMMLVAVALVATMAEARRGRASLRRITASLRRS
jgi:putative peptidoglycan lipid II flippase